MFKKLFLILNFTFILLINLVLGISFFLTQKIYIQETKKSILSQINTIRTFLLLENKWLANFPITNLTSSQKWLIVNLTKYPYWKVSNSRIIEKNYLIYQTYFHGYIITVWKDLSELKNIKDAFLKAWLIVNIIWLVISFILAFLISKNTLKTIDYLQTYFKNYDFKNPREIKFIPKEKELKDLVNQINKFVKMYQQILNNQKEFIQDVSHQLKTPLMQIYSTLEIIESKVDNKVSQKIQQIKNSLEHLKNIISDLNFVFNENNFSQNKEINLKSIIEDISSKYQDFLKKKNIKLILDLEDVTKVLNQSLFEKLIDNLLSNAVFYNKENWEIFIKLDNNWLIIKDTWIWIDKSDLEKIFDRFYRWKNSYEFYSNGSWLWLNIVKKIIDHFWWQIFVNSEKWKWTTFRIKFNKNLTNKN